MKSEKTSSIKETFQQLTKKIFKKSENTSFIKRKGIQSFIASVVCILAGLFVALIVLLFINAKGAPGAIVAIIRNFFKYSTSTMRIKYFGNTLVKSVPLIMCALAVLFSYKVGLFNIGTSGQYCAGICAAIFAALKWHWGWLPCLILAMIAGALLASIVGVLKAYLNVNEVISGIMLNWICLYMTNTILSAVKDPTSPYTLKIMDNAPKAVLPSIGLDRLLKNEYITIAIPLAIIVAVAIYIIMEKTKFGYELKATGYNKNAAKYCGMAENRNIILSLSISGLIAGFGAGLFYLTGYAQYEVTATSVPAMGFNGIAATFLGGLNPIGTIFSSYFIQHITDGGANVDLSKFSSQTSDLISSLIIYFCGFVLFIKVTINNLIKKSESKADSITKGGKN